MRINQFFEITFTKAVLNLKSEASRTYLSYLWWVLEPCLYMAVFYVVFGLLLNSGTENFVAFLLTGLIPWLWFSKSITNASYSILSGKGLMLQMYMPKIFFPAVVIVQDFLKQILVFAILLMTLCLIGLPITWYWLMIFILMPIQLILISGLSALCAIITPFLPDFRLILNTGLTLLMFGSGIFYKMDTIQPEYQTYMFFNPLAELIKAYRDVLVYSQLPSLNAIAYILVFSIFFLSVSLFFLIKLDRQFTRAVSEL